MDKNENEFKEETDISDYGSLGKMEKKEKFGRQSFLSATSKPHFQTKLANLIIKYSRGRIRNENHANYVLLVLTAIIFVISLFFWFGILL